MKVLIIIRTYPIDDFISYLCWESWKKVIPDADFIFFAQKEEDPPPGTYKWIVKTDAKILRRPYCENFGGRTHVEACVVGLKMVDTNGYDRIVFSDADIIAHKNPFDREFDYGGIMQVGNPRHYSGQVLLFKRWLFDMIVGFKQYEPVFDSFIKNGYKSISDDTIFSWLATEFTNNRRNFHDLEYWTHKKMHELEPTSGHDCKVCGEPFDTLDDLYFHYDYKHNKGL